MNRLPCALSRCVLSHLATPSRHPGTRRDNRTRARTLNVLRPHFFSTTKQEESALNRITELCSQLKSYARQYFTEHTSPVTDEEYDTLLAELRGLEEQYPQYQKSDSPTQTVGFQVATSTVGTVKHSSPMLSLSNTYNENEVAAFAERVKKGLAGSLDSGPLEYVAELKFDGVALSLVYKGGKFVRAVTRGDGTEGEDVTANAKRFIATLPATVKPIDGVGLDFEVRGEVIVTKEDFTKGNEALKAEGGSRTQYSNPRNLASGILSRKHHDRHAAPIRLTFMAYALLSKQSLESHWASLQAMKAMGFTTDTYASKLKTIDSVLDVIHKIGQERQMLPFEIDGVVVKVNSIAHQQLLGRTAHSPKWAMAYKFRAQQLQTKIVDIKLQVGRTGKVTPVALVEPVSLSGIIISRATLHNKEYVEQLGIKIGSTVLIERSADVIPKITGCVKSDNDSTRPVDGPAVDWKSCPCELKQPLIPSETGIDMFCRSPDCPEQRSRVIRHFVSRDALSMDGFGPRSIDDLIDGGFLADVADIFDLELHREAMEKLEGWGPRSVEVLLQGIETGKKLSNMERVLNGLGVPHVGKETAILLSKHFKTFDSLMKASVDQLLAIPSVGEIVATGVHTFFHPPSKDAQQRVTNMINRLSGAGLNLNYSKYNPNAAAKAYKKSGSASQSETTEGDAKLPLSGHAFVFTGKMLTLTRGDASDAVEALGGEVKSAVVKGVTYLITGDMSGESTKKLDAAQAKGITILDEAAFKKLVGR